MVKRLGIISTLSYCDLPDGHRELFGAIRSKIKREDLKAFALAILPFVDRTKTFLPSGMKLPGQRKLKHEKEEPHYLILIDLKSWSRRSKDLN
jgi:hypothetical protein